MRETLRDGTEIEIAPAGPDFRERTLEIFEGLSDESRYRRFLGHPAADERQLATLTEIDHYDHEALVAVDLASDRAVGVARFIRNPRATEAEVAVSVIDEWQGKGLGTVLLHHLVERARTVGVERLSAYMFASNRDMLELMKSVGPLDEVHREGSTLEVHLPIGTPVPRERLTAWLRNAAAGAMDTTIGLTRRAAAAANERVPGSARPDSPPDR